MRIRSDTTATRGRDIGASRAPWLALRAVAAIATVVLLTLAMSGEAAASKAPRKMWGARFDGSAHGVDAATYDGVSPDGSTLFVTGRSAGAGTSTFDYVTIAYDAASGARRWGARYNGPAGTNDEAVGVAVSPTVRPCT